MKWKEKFEMFDKGTNKYTAVNLFIIITAISKCKCMQTCTAYAFMQLWMFIPNTFEIKPTSRFTTKVRIMFESIEINRNIKKWNK